MDPMDDPDANVLYIHAPKANDLAAWVLNTGVFLFFGLGVIFVIILLKISTDVAHTLETLQNAQPQEEEEEEEEEKPKKSKTRTRETGNKEGIITIYGNKPNGGGGGSGGDRGGGYGLPPSMMERGHFPRGRGGYDLRNRESLYFGFTSARYPAANHLIPNQQFGLPNAFQSTSGTDIDPDSGTLYQLRHNSHRQNRHGSPPRSSYCQPKSELYAAMAAERSNGNSESRQRNSSSLPGNQSIGSWTKCGTEPAAGSEYFSYQGMPRQTSSRSSCLSTATKAPGNGIPFANYYTYSRDH